MFNLHDNNTEGGRPQNGSAHGQGTGDGRQSYPPNLLPSTLPSQSQKSSGSVPQVPPAMESQPQQANNSMDVLRTNQIEGLAGLTPQDLARAALAMVQMPESNPSTQTQNSGLNPNNLAMAIATGGLAGLAGLGGGSAFEILQRLQQICQLQPYSQDGGNLNELSSNLNELSSQRAEAMSVPDKSSSDSKDYESASKTSDMKEKSSSLSSSKKESDGVTNLVESSSSCGNNSGSALPMVPVKLPCRARGMPVDHNFRTAHFTITTEVRHGEFLQCSYKECRNDGVKFRYCATCRIPVAKRNFYQRHSHDGMIVGNDDRKEPGSMKPKSGRGPKKAASKENKVTKKQAFSNDVAFESMRPRSSQEKPCSSARKPPPKPSSESDCPLAAGGVTEDRMSSFQGSSESDTAAFSGLNDAVHLSNAARKSENPGPDNDENIRQLRWSTLLANRPDSSDADGMSAWLLEVMAVSDLKNPMKNRGDESSSLTGSFPSKDESHQSTSSVTSSSSSTSGTGSYDLTDSVSETRDNRKDRHRTKHHDETHRKRKRPRSSEHGAKRKKHHIEMDER